MGTMLARPIPSQSRDKRGSGTPNWELRDLIARSHGTANTREQAARRARNQDSGRQHTAARPTINMRNALDYMFSQCPFR